MHPHSSIAELLAEDLIRQRARSARGVPLSDGAGRRTSRRRWRGQPPPA